MVPWKLIERAAIPNSRDEISLYRRGDELSIRIGARELMNSRTHGSEETLAELACADLRQTHRPRVLIGGLGMGYTLAAALAALPDHGRVTVAELVPAVVRWNLGGLGPLTQHASRDRRVQIEECDVAARIRAERSAFDAILLDVDNGPEALTHPSNAWLYSAPGLATIAAALRPRGRLAVWSASPEHGFAQRLRRAGFIVKERRTPARGPQQTGRAHTIWIAQVSPST